MKNIALLNYHIFCDELSSILTIDKSKIIINTINAHSYIVAKKDNKFKLALKNSDILLPDCVGIVFASKILNNRKIKQITGPDLFYYMLEYCNKNKMKCFFLGSTTETLLKIKKKINNDYSNIAVDYYSPPFKIEFSKEDNEKMISAINKFNPQVLFIGMTAPKQEKWVYDNKDMINAKYICSVGAAFDFYCGNKKFPGKVWRQLGLIWLFRFIQEPKRLLYRNIISLPSFAIEVLINKIFKK